jgi:hypothetical protein
MTPDPVVDYIEEHGLFIESSQARDSSGRGFPTKVRNRQILCHIQSLLQEQRDGVWSFYLQTNARYQRFFNLLSAPRS